MSTGSRVQRRELSDILIDENLVDRDQVTEALQIQSTTGETLSAILLDMNAISSQEIAKYISLHFQLPFMSFRNYEFDAKSGSSFPKDFLHQHKILPFDSVGEMVLCGVAEIPSEKVLAEIPRIAGKRVAFFVLNLEEMDLKLQENFPLDEDSELLKRRQHIRSAAAQGGTAKAPAAEEEQLFSDQSSEALLTELDSTWDSIFDEMEGGEEDDDEATKLQ